MKASNKTNRKQIEVLTAERYAVAVKECARILTEEPEQWNTQQVEGGEIVGGSMWESFGPLGVMSPINRLAFVEQFGEEQTAQVEAAARQSIQDKADRAAATHYAQHAAEADKAAGVPALGSFFWGFSSCFKCDHGRGIFGEVADSVERYGEDKEEQRARLCRVDKVITVTPEEFNRPELADELAKAEQLPGGSFSEDVPEDADYFETINNPEAVATFYTLGAIVTDGARWFLIDSEGYDYPRYIYKPQEWREMYADEVARTEKEEAEREERARLENMLEKARRHAEYKERCKKWAGIMQDVRPLEEAEKEAEKVPGAWSKNTAASKARQAAERKTNNARRANILAMCAKAFPGLKVSVTHCREWGANWRISWTDGPTVEEFKSRTDLGLFCRRFDTFDGMTDYADTEDAEFTEFADLAMGSDWGQIDTERGASPECLECVTQATREALGEPVEDWQELTDEQFFTTRARLAENNPEVEEIRNYGRMTVRELARRVWDCVSFYTEPEQPTTPTDPTTPTTPDNGGKGDKVTTTADAAPAEGLELVSTPRGLAVVGDSRVTFKNRHEIKAHGARWNKTAQQWEATTEKDCDALRAWFALASTTEAEQPAEPEQVETTTNEPSEEVRQALKSCAEHPDKVALFYSVLLNDYKRLQYGEDNEQVDNYARTTIGCADGAQVLYIFRQWYPEFVDALPTQRQPVYYTAPGWGSRSSRYVVHFHDGRKTHKDGSPFYDVQTFSNKKDCNAFLDDLKNRGYLWESFINRNINA